MQEKYSKALAVDYILPAFGICKIWSLAWAINVMFSVKVQDLVQDWELMNNLTHRNRHDGIGNLTYAPWRRVHWWSDRRHKWSQKKRFRIGSLRTTLHIGAGQEGSSSSRLQKAIPISQLHIGSLYSWWRIWATTNLSGSTNSI
ncbi:hypothetical protein PoB_007647600 [Plakobranchus ocellatus]|uniref:Uncharacterized protein n=1 Tax=Plakobranchus ocellatus TaxID=259542 RepID=A0AAV4E0X5_9GAST|nr:hypothetical protein PoB_007647600 [Plakobranchus ocellatus]